MKKAEFYAKKDGNTVQCLLCPHNCVIAEGRSGICGARKNAGGELFTLNYGIVSGASMDPIEKKPLYHFYPGSTIFSIGTVGCNLHCPFCQNYHISRYFESRDTAPGNGDATPESILKSALKNSDFRAIAYTYSEPMVWYEFVRDTASLLKEKGILNVLVTNGFINEEPLAGLLPLISAANIDLKAFTEAGYRKLGGKLAPVLDNIVRFRAAGVRVELTTLVVTGFNDSLDEMEKMIDWIAGVDKNMPLHLSRYFPQYQYDKPPTDIRVLEKIRDMALKKLSYVYLGNTGGESDTFCPACKNRLVERRGYQTRISGIKDSRCAQCSRPADIILAGEGGR